jgi:hypothetical protein
MLPTQTTPRTTNLRDLSALVYGPSKIGKSAWCAAADRPLFLAVDRLQHLETFQVPIDTWEALLAACNQIAEGDHDFKTIVIDTIDHAYRMCAEFVCRKFKVEHESDLGYGKGHALVHNEFYRVLNRLTLLPYTVMLVSHAQEREIETRTGKFTRIVPTLPEKARKTVLGMVDLILFCDLETTTGADGKPIHRRVLRTKPHPDYEAGDRTGRLPEVIDLDFATFAAAFAQGAAPTSGSSATR